MSLLCPRPKPSRDAPSIPSEDEQLECLVCACGNTVVVGSLKPNASGGASSLLLEVDRSPVACLSFSPSGTLLAACSEDKRIRVWSAITWELLGERTIPKRGTVLQFTGDDRTLLVADKTGEVTSYEVCNINVNQGSHLFGHLSMVLDMVLLPSSSHVVTCDRDEKIRVSRYPNSYNIETFCLGHTEFVSVLSISPIRPDLLLSGGGDGTVRTWVCLTGELLHTEAVASCSQNQELPVITQLTCSHRAKDAIVVVAVEGSTKLLSFFLSSDGQFTSNPDGAILLDMPPWSCAFDWSDCLWVCLPQETEPLQCYRLEGCKVLCKDNPLLKTMCRWEYFRGCGANIRDWLQLRKHTFDNMSTYLAKKEERIRSKVAAKETTEVEAEGILEPHPPKAPRLETAEGHSQD